MFWPCATRTSTCRNFAPISSGLYRFLVITVLLDVKDIPQVGPRQWGRINLTFEQGTTIHRAAFRLDRYVADQFDEFGREPVGLGAIEYTVLLTRDCRLVGVAKPGR